MTTMVEQELRTRIEGFVLELEKLVRQSAVEAVEAALTNGRPVKRARVARSAEPRAPREPKKGARRTRAQLRKTADLLKHHVAEKPGENMEQITESLRKPTRALRRPMNWLLAKGEIVRVGEKRASRYYLPGAVPKKRAKR